MKAYKLTGQDNKTYDDFLWVVGKKERTDFAVHCKEQPTLCSHDVFHSYCCPEIAVAANIIHANIKNPRLWEVEIEGTISMDALKVGTTELRLLKEVECPKISTAALVGWAIKCAMTVYHEKGWTDWAKGWLNGGDRSEQTARAAAAYADANAAAAYDNDNADALAAANAAHAAAYAANAALASAAYAAAHAADANAYAADANAYAAYAAYTAYTAANAAYAAAYAANAAADAAAADANAYAIQCNPTQLLMEAIKEEELRPLTQIEAYQGMRV
jgi:hypothetical protein